MIKESKYAHITIFFYLEIKNVSLLGEKFHVNSKTICLFL